MDFSKSMAVAASGMRSQTDRMKVIAENIANANSTSPVKGGDPYRRKIATITQNFDSELGAELVKPGKPLPDGWPGPILYCAVIVKTVDERTRARTSINELLRE